MSDSSTDDLTEVVYSFEKDAILDSASITEPESTVQTSQEDDEDDNDDPRVQIEEPWEGDSIERSTVQIESTFTDDGEETTGRGSGVIIDEFHVLTVAHNVYDAGRWWDPTDDELGWADEVVVRPSPHRDDLGKVEHFSVANARIVRTYEEYVDDGDIEHDVALLTLDRSLGATDRLDQIPWEAYDADDPIYEDTFIRNRGYPGDPPDDEFYPTMWAHSGDALGHYEDNEGTLEVDLYASKGHSGSALYHRDVMADEWEILGILARGPGDEGQPVHGPRITHTKDDHLDSWLAADHDEEYVDEPMDKPEFVFDGSRFTRESGDWPELSPTEGIVLEETELTISHRLRNVGTVQGADEVDLEVYATEPSASSCSEAEEKELIATESVPTPQPFETQEVEITTTVPDTVEPEDGHLGICLTIDAGVEEFTSQEPDHKEWSPGVIELADPALEIDVVHNGADAEDVDGLLLYRDGDVIDEHDGQLDTAIDLPHTFDELDADSYTVEAYSQNMFVGPATVDLEVGIHESVTVSAPPLATVEYTIYYADGETPLSDATVTSASHEEVVWRNATTDDDGVATVDLQQHLQHDDGEYDDDEFYTVTVEHEGDVVGEETLEVVDGDLEREFTTERSQLNAAFTFSPSEPHPGDTVTFDAGDSTGDVETYEWDFGDGATATGETVSHTYDDAGEYEVTLTIIDQDGREDTTSATLDVFGEPTATFSADPETVDRGETVAFDASESDSPNGDIVAYRWDFTGDGEFDETGGELTEPTFEYDVLPGEYEATLEIEDEEGVTDTTTETVTVDGSIRVNDDGSEDFESIQEAIDAADPDLVEEITVQSGTYEETVEITKQGLTLQGVNSGAGLPEIEREDETAILVTGMDEDDGWQPAHDVTVAGFVVTTANLGVQVGSDMQEPTANVTVQQLTFEAVDTGLRIDGDDATVAESTFSGDGGTVRIDASGTTVTDCTFEGDRDSFEYAIRVWAGADTEIFDNEFVGLGNGVLLTNEQPVTVEDNAFDSASLAFQQDLGTDTYDNVIEGNTVNDKSLVYHEGVDGVTVDGEAGQIIVVDSADVTITGQNFDGSHRPIQLLDSTDCEISDVEITNAGIDSIRVRNSEQITVADSSILDSQQGIMLVDSTELTVEDNTIDTIEFAGVGADGVEDVLIQGNDIVATGGSGISILGVDGTVTIDENLLEDIGTGSEFEATAISVRGGDSGAVTSNTVTDSTLDGIFVDTETVGVHDNDVHGSGLRGIVLFGQAGGNTITGNDVTDSDESGIRIDNAAGVTVENNTSTSNGEAGIWVDDSADSTLANNVAHGNDDWDVSIFGESPNTVVKDLDIGASTASNTTVSFEGQNVSVHGVSSPPDNPDAAAIGRYFEATNQDGDSVLDVDLHYEDSDVDDDTEDSIQLWRYGDSEWETVDGSAVDTESNVVTASPDASGIFGAFTDEEPFTQLPESAWTHDTGHPIQHARPEVTDAYVYVGGLSAMLYAIPRDADSEENGTVHDWAVERDGALSDSSPVAWNGQVFVGSGGGGLYALDPEAEEPDWHVETDSAITASPTVDEEEGVVFFASSDGTVHARDVDDSSAVWTESVDSPVYSRLDTDGDRVFLTTADGALYAIDSGGGDPVLIHDFDEPLGWSSPTVHDGRVYVAADELFAIETDTDDVADGWPVEHGGTAGSSPVIANGTIYVGSADGWVYGLDPDGTVVAEADLGDEIVADVAVEGSTVVATTRAGTLTLLDTDLSVLDTDDLPAPCRSPPVLADGEIYVGDSTGWLHAYR